MFARRARELVSGLFDRVFGEGFFADVQEFLEAFSGMFSTLRAHADSVRALLAGPEAAFVVVTSPEDSALEEGEFLRARLLAMKLPVAGYVLNRSWAYTRGLADPESLVLAADAPPSAHSGLRKLVALAAYERRLAQRDRELLAKLAGLGGNACATPNVGGAVTDLAGLLELAESFLERERPIDAALPV
jgi:anion-transporting  ArsA/GET3 family ATPase